MYPHLSAHSAGNILKISLKLIGQPTRRLVLI